GHLQQRLQRRDRRRGDRGQVAGDVRGRPDLAGQRRRLDVAAPVGPQAPRGRRPGTRPASPARRLGGLDEGPANHGGPLSSITSCTIINLIKAEVARLLTEAGHAPKVLTSTCHLGADRARQLFEETYDDYRRRVGVLYH